MNTIRKKILLYVSLHFLLMFYSLSGVLCKKAAGTIMFSFDFFVYYGIVILLLGIYAIGWQQIIKRLPLTIAFSNRAVCVIWGIIWGIVIFKETINIWKVVGAVIVMIGVAIYSRTDAEENEKNE